MKLTGDQLYHATEVQLRAIGTYRKNNKGWMRIALKTEFTADQIAAFEAAGLCRKQRKKPIEDHPELFPDSSPADDFANQIFAQNRQEFE